MKIAVHGSYFVRNFGDTLLIKILVDWIKEHGNHEIVLPFVTTELEAFEIGVKAGYTDKENIDLLIYAGGGYFGEPNTTFIKRYLWYYRNWKRHLKWVSKLKPKKIIILGIGFGPLRNLIFRKKVLSLFRKAELIIVRDIESLNYLTKYGYSIKNVKLGVDLAYSIGQSVVHEDNQSSNKIGLHIPIIGDQLSTEFTQHLNFLYSYPEVELLIDGPARKFPHDEIFFDKKIGDRKIKIKYYKNPDHLINQIKTYKLIITSKLHMGIIATNLGVPVYSIPNHTKTLRYYNQIEYSDNCNPIYEFSLTKHQNIIEKFPNITAAIIPKSHYETIKEIKNFLFKILDNIVI